MNAISKYTASIAATIVIAVAAWFVYDRVIKDDAQIAIVDRIMLVAKLQTVEFYSTAVVTKSHSDWANARVDVVFVFEGNVTANVDLEKMGIEISETDAVRHVKIKLPPVQVSKAALTNSQTLSECKSFITAPNLPKKKRDAAFRDAQKIIAAAAAKHKIKDKALIKAKDYLTTFVEALGYEVTFV